MNFFTMTGLSHLLLCRVGEEGGSVGVGKGGLE